MSLKEALENIEKKFGKGTVILYGDEPSEDVDVVSTGVPSLDTALGINGLPQGRMVEVFGPESSGKTTLALHVLAEAQAKGLQVAFIDVEHALDPKYAAKLGVDMDRVLISQPDSAEQALEVLEALVRSGEVSIVVLDSVAALAPRAELEGEYGDALVGVIARLMSSACRKLTHTVSENNCMVVFINQLRDKIGSFGYGSPETTTGGRALKYYCSVRLDVRRIQALKSGEEIFGHKTRIKIVKNKFSAPHKEVDADMVYGEGFSKESDLLDLALKKGEIIKKGAWFYFDNVSIGQGRETVRNNLKEDKELFEKVKAAVLEQV